VSLRSSSLLPGFGMKSFAYDPYIPADKIQAWSSGSIYVSWKHPWMKD
jgi:hypothetical protein